MNNTRRDFIKQIGMAAGGVALSQFLPFSLQAASAEAFDFKISLAEWSLHKALFSKQITHLDFPVVTKKEYGIEAVEYVSQFFPDKAKDTAYLSELKKRCDDNGVNSLLIMVDQEGSLASNDEKHRNEAVENHYKWVEAAKFLGCHSIRVNLHGEGKEEEWLKASIEGLRKLVEFAAPLKMNVIVENHGQWSSKGNLVAKVMTAINNPYCGTLPDFGNFCVRRRDGDLWESPCAEWYDRYQGIKEMLPFAKGISAKAFDFDAKGEETTIDFHKMFRLVKASGFKGYVGIEFEGEKLSEEQGIKATMNLLGKIRTELR